MSVKTFAAKEIPLEFPNKQENREASEDYLIKFTENDYKDNEWSLQNELGSLPEYSDRSQRRAEESNVFENSRYPKPISDYPNLYQKTDEIAKPQTSIEKNSLFIGKKSEMSDNNLLLKQKAQILECKKTIGDEPTLVKLPPLPPKPKEYLGKPGMEKNALALDFDRKSDTKTDIVYNDMGIGLRPIFIPSRLCSVFLKYADKNTQNNLETCGVMCGKIENGVLRVTTLIIPQQSATSDTCNTENEEDIFLITTDNELLTLGWIHTHPSQSCFMSSLDLHTHCSYQLMLPEAIAIVCAPKSTPDLGFFRLTDPPGLDIIRDCPTKSTFHPHEEENIYMEASENSHVKMSNYDFDVIDLR
ncbi:hypothetical protein BB558_004393 [Smittium angustum]|uniref:MPN domain-containing protein n=1 Tax=Smittium angustum TaxID=133377 RepID=A0A2U1J3B8_SMIAN|nr:hypothetical protein BB558_004393 [Smittium angustum]